MRKPPDLRPEGRQKADIPAHLFISASISHHRRPHGTTPTLAFPLLSSQTRSVSGITYLLSRLEQGDARPADELPPLVYDELRRLAANKMATEAPGHTLQPTALVHEAWLRLGGSDAPSFQNRAHFFGAAAEAMRRILIERARRRVAANRGAGAA